VAIRREAFVAVSLPVGRTRWSDMVREGRFELPRPCGHRILSPARLPGSATLALQVRVYFRSVRWVRTPIRLSDVCTDAEQNAGDALGGVTLDAFTYVGVRVQGDSDGAVPQPFLNDLRMDPRRKSDRGPSVAQVVQSDPRRAGCPYELLEPVGEAIWMDRGAVLSSEDHLGQVVRLEPQRTRGLRPGLEHEPVQRWAIIRPRSTTNPDRPDGNFEIVPPFKSPSSFRFATRAGSDPSVFGAHGGAADRARLARPAQPPRERSMGTRRAPI
jgi:hypothetical protein